eukprot:1144633-Pelagomonas_calceolata.AAC.4
MSYVTLSYPIEQTLRHRAFVQQCSKKGRHMGYLRNHWRWKEGKPCSHSSFLLQLNGYPDQDSFHATAKHECRDAYLQYGAMNGKYNFLSPSALHSMPRIPSGLPLS